MRNWDGVVWATWRSWECRCRSVPYDVNDMGAKTVAMPLSDVAFVVSQLHLAVYQFHVIVSEICLETRCSSLSCLSSSHSLLLSVAFCNWLQSHPERG